MNKRKSKIVLLGRVIGRTLRVVRSEFGNYRLEESFYDAMGVRSWRPYTIDTADRMMNALGDLAYDGMQRRRAAQRRKR